MGRYKENGYPTGSYRLIDKADSRLYFDKACPQCQVVRGVRCAEYSSTKICKQCAMANGRAQQRLNVELFGSATKGRRTISDQKLRAMIKEVMLEVSAPWPAPSWRTRNCRRRTAARCASEWTSSTGQPACAATHVFPRSSHVAPALQLIRDWLGGWVSVLISAQHCLGHSTAFIHRDWGLRLQATRILRPGHEWLVGDKAPSEQVLD